jgi:UDP-N-acetylglucosamine:LPS N-acetylglucosamine transferase
LELLLERAHAVVHHAGAGTIREVIREGLPSIAIPGPFDTCWNAVRFAQLDERMSIVRSDQPLQVEMERLAAQPSEARTPERIGANGPPLESICRELSQLRKS